MRSKLISATSLSVVVVALFLMAPAEESHALWPLKYTWDCDAYGHCAFYVGTSNHSSYGWNFGDGTPLSQTTSANISHFFAGPSSQWYTFNVALIGYKPDGSGIDNIIGCNVTFWKSGPGGDPSRFTGTCG